MPLVDMIWHSAKALLAMGKMQRRRLIEDGEVSSGDESDRG